MLTITKLVLLCGLHSFSVYWLFSERNEIKMEPRSVGGVLGKIRGKTHTHTHTKKAFLDCGCVTCPIDWSWTPAGGNSPCSSPSGKAVGTLNLGKFFASHKGYSRQGFDQLSTEGSDQERNVEDSSDSDTEEYSAPPPRPPPPQSSS